MKLIRWLLLSGAVLAAPAFADSELGYGPAPAWATLEPVVVKPKPDDAAAVEFLLLDSQLRLDPNGLETVVHYAARLNNAQALSGGNLAVAWDPAFDTATINSVKIRRGNETIDPLAKGQKFTILRREQGLEQQTLDGRLTATLQTEGLQIGDVIEMTQTIVHRDPTLKGHVEAAMAFAYPSRFETARLRIVVPTSVTVRQRTTGGLAPAVAVKAGRDTVYQWNLSPLEPDKPAENSPDRFRTGIGFEMTDYRSWADLAAMFVPLFETAAKIAPTSPLMAEIERIRAASPDPKVRAAAALALVEGQVRYVNIALGVGGLVPVGADTTWQRRFGDCKAKTALLTAILRALEIDATPVLVNTVLGDGLDQRLPKVTEFNHVLVRSVIGGREYWLDGTRMGDVTLDSLEVPGFRWGLPIGPDAKLLPIVQTPLSQPSSEKIILTDATNGVSGPVPTTLELVLRGDAALVRNMMLTSVEGARRDALLKQQMENMLDRFVVSKVTWTHDPLTQTMRLRAEGAQTLNISGSTYWSETPSLGYKADFRRTSPRDPDAPIKVDFPLYERTAQTLILPKTISVSYPLRPSDISAKVAGMEYKRTVTRKGAAVTVDTSSRSLVPEITIAEARAAEPELRKLDNDYFRFNLPVTIQPTNEEVAKLAGTLPKTADEYMMAAVKFMNDDKPGQAIALLDKAVALSPASFNVRFMRASLRASRGEEGLALADLETALKLNPLDPNARGMHAGMMLRQGNRVAAVADAQALVPADNGRAQLVRAQILSQADRVPEALAALELALSYDPDPLTHVFRANIMPIADRNARRKEIDAAMKLNPRDPVVLVALASLARELGDFDQQLTLLDKAFLQMPDNLAIRGQRAIALFQSGRTSEAGKEFDALAAKDLSANEWNNQCWYKAVANTELTRALADCDKAIAQEDRPEYRDSRAFVLLRLGKFDEAIKDYDQALAAREFPQALFGRAVAYARLGRKVESDTDMAKAVKLDSSVARKFAGYGVAL
ncbi:MAG: DUF3857 domain-containing protein [Novosphingobium sp.]